MTKYRHINEFANNPEENDMEEVISKPAKKRTTAGGRALRAVWNATAKPIGKGWKKGYKAADRSGAKIQKSANRLGNKGVKQGVRGGKQVWKHAIGLVGGVYNLGAGVAKSGYAGVKYGAGTARRALSPIIEQLDEQALLEHGVNDYDLNNYDYFLVEKKVNVASKVGKSVGKGVDAVLQQFNDAGEAVDDAVDDLGKGLKATKKAIVKVAKMHKKNINASLKHASKIPGKLAKAAKKEGNAWVKDAKVVGKEAKSIGRAVVSNSAAKRRMSSGLSKEDKAKGAEYRKELKNKRKLNEDVTQSSFEAQPNLAVAVQAAIAGNPTEFQSSVADALKAKAIEALDSYKQYTAANMFNDNQDDEEDYETYIDEDDLEGGDIVAEWVEEGPDPTDDEDDGWEDEDDIGVFEYEPSEDDDDDEEEDE